MSKEPLGDKLDDFRAQYRAEQAGLRQRIAALEAQNAALAAALVATPMPAIIDNDAPGAEESNLTLTWRKGKVYDWWATREPDMATARRILDARDLEMRQRGGREALRFAVKLCGKGFMEGAGEMLRGVSETWTPRERQDGEAG